MRYLSYFVLGFAGACGVSAYWLGGFLPGAGGAALLLLGFLYYEKKKKRLPVGSLAAAGLLFGMLWFFVYEQIFLKPLSVFEGKKTEAEVLVTRGPEKTEGITVLGGKPCRVRLQVAEKEACLPGSRVHGTFLLERRARSFPSGLGTTLTASAQGPVKLLPAERKLSNLPFTLRRWSEGVMDFCIPGASGEFAKALMLGDTEGLDFITRWDLSTSGIRHMVAVSGLHMSILCLMISFLFLGNRWLSVLVGIPIMVLFGAVTGFSPSVLRAVIMMSFLMLARLVYRRYDPVTELSAAVLFMLLLDPMTITSVSFQLSVASVLGIFFHYRDLDLWLLKKFPVHRDFRDRIRNWLCSSLAVSISSLVFVTPLLAFHFGSISLIAPLTNLLTVFLVPPVFWGILLMLGLSLLSLRGAMILGTVLSLPIRWILVVSHGMARVPMAAVYTDSIYMVLWLLAVYAAGFCLLGHGRKRWRPFLGISLAGLFLASALSWGLPRMGTHVTALDAGNGRCILLQSQGKTYLVDCGGSRGDSLAEQAAQALLSQGVRHLDGLILTGLDEKHAGQAENLLKIVDTDALYVPDGKGLTEDPRLRLLRENTVFPLENGELTVIKGVSSGETACSLLFDSPDYDILIAGGGVQKLPCADCLVPDPGAGAEALPELLKAVKPEAVVLTPKGAAAWGKLDRNLKLGCQVLKWDRGGVLHLGRGRNG